MSFHDIARAIASFKRLDLRAASIEYIIERLLPIFGGYQHAFNSILAGNVLYRAVKHDTCPSELKGLREAPAEYVKCIGRFNRKAQSQFYCSAASAGAIYEIQPEAGTRLVLGQWLVEREILPLRIGYHREAFDRMGSVRSRASYEHFLEVPYMTPAVRAIQRFVGEYVSCEVKADETYRYNLSIAIAEHLLGVEGRIDVPQGQAMDGKLGGIVYPSLRMIGFADNAAIFPEIARSHMRPTQAWYIEASPLGRNNGYTLDILDRAPAFAGETIQWEGDRWLAQPLRARRMRIEFIDDAWVRYDGDGNLIDRYTGSP